MLKKEEENHNSLVVDQLSRSSDSPSARTPDSSIALYRLPIERLSKADPANVQQIAASQIELLSNYHQEVLSQAKKSFFWALIAAVAGFSFFLLTLFFIARPQQEEKSELALVSTVGGVLIEVISAINFYLYGKASLQMADFQKRLDRTQRFLLANSICESLEGDSKQQARSELIRVIAGLTVVQHDDLSEAKEIGESV